MRKEVIANQVTRVLLDTEILFYHKLLEKCMEIRAKS